VPRHQSSSINQSNNKQLQSNPSTQFNLTTTSTTKKPLQKTTAIMVVNLYTASVPVFIRYLTNLSTFLKKGETHADEKSIPHNTILNTKLHDDMAALAFQIQRASDSAKGAGARVSGGEAPSMEDNETTFADLYARIDKTVEYLKSIDPKSFDGKDDAEVTLKTPNKEYKFSGETYLLNFAIPNFYFHVTAAYAILRHAGVPVGKYDYLGTI
jgi:hypothetical protein